MFLHIAEREAQEPFPPVYCFSSYFKEAISLTSQKTSHNFIAHFQTQKERSFELITKI
jgi:hypothetical protein